MKPFIPAIAAACLIASVSSSGALEVATADTFACKDRTVVRGLSDMMRKLSVNAYNRYLGELRASGECRNVVPGTRLITAENWACARVGGTCYWTPSNTLTVTVNTSSETTGSASR